MDSHIVPNFHYKEMKGAENYFLILSTDPRKKEKHAQKGITEYLLCAKCDNERLSKYEGHARKVIFGGTPLDIKPDGRFLKITGFDYKSLKNGLLSILWRMSISSNSYYSEIDLGARHNERLRLAFLNDAEIGEEEYPVWLGAPVLKGEPLGHCMIPPDFAKVDNNRVYRCLISGLIFTYIVGSAPLDAITKQLILRRHELPVMRVDVARIPFLNEAMHKLARASTIRDMQ